MERIRTEDVVAAILSLASARIFRAGARRYSQTINDVMNRNDFSGDSKALPGVIREAVRPRLVVSSAAGWSYQQAAARTFATLASSKPLYEGPRIKHVASQYATAQLGADIARVSASYRDAGRLHPYAMQWIADITTNIKSYGTSVYLTSWVRPFLGKRSLHETGLAVDLCVINQAGWEHALQVVLTDVLEWLRSGLASMAYFGRSRTGNWIIHIETHRDASGATLPGPRIWNGRHDEWLH